MKLRAKFILFFTILFASLATLGALYFNYSVRKSFKEQILNNLSVLTEENESTYFAFTGQLRTLTINWSSDNYIKELAEKIVDQSLSPTARAKASDDFGVYLRDKKMLYNKSVAIVDVLDDQGIVVASNQNERIGVDEGEEEREHGMHYFSKTINADFGEAFVRGIVFEEDESTEPMSHVTTRLFSTKLDAEGKFIPLPAVLLVHFVSLTQLADILQGLNKLEDNKLTGKGFIQSFETSDTYLVNSNRLLVTPTRLEPNVTYTTHISTAPVEECLQNGKEITGEYLNYRGSPVFGVSMCLVEDGLVLIKEIETWEAYKLFTLLWQGTISYGGIVFMTIIIATFLTARSLLHRIRIVTSAAEKVAHGDFTAYASFRGNDEISILATTFNTMTAKLRDLYRNLEDKVAKRTKLLKLDKAKIEALLQSIGEGIISTDEQGKVIKVNHAAEKMLGRKEYELLGKMFTEIVPAYNEKGEVIHNEARALSIVLARGAPPTPFLASFARKDGTRFPVSVLVSPVIFEGSLIGATAAIRDTTKEKEIEKMRLDLLSLASHQLRTPLSGTKWLIETLRKGIHGPLNKEQDEYIEEIYKINERMTGLVSDMLSALRIESGMESFQTEAVSVSSLFDALSSTMTPVAQAKQIFLRFNTEESATLATARELLRNILESFISNAITYSPAGTEVSVDIKNDPTSVTFSVTDHGIGVPKDEQAGIFSRFYRASNARTANTRGSGLGLYIASVLAEKIAGKVYFVSEEGKGSTFYVWVPKEVNKNSSNG